MATAGDKPFLSLSSSPVAVRPQPAGPGRRSTKPPKAIPPPYPWATNHKATVHSVQHLLGQGIDAIAGSVQCKRCDRQFEVEYDLRSKFREVAVFIAKHSEEMRQRAPEAWTSPALPDCRFCEQRGCAKPVATEKKREINWLFLFLGQMLGCCKLAELKYFCKQNKKHKTGAKDRLLFSTYMEIYSQLQPHGHGHGPSFR